MKLGMIVYNDELQIKFEFRCYWSIFAWVIALGLRIFMKISVFRTYFGLFLYAHRKTGRIMLWRCPSMVISVFQTFFAIFADIRLKLGLLFCRKELQIRFTFQCDWFIFARVMPVELSRISDFFSFPDYLCDLCRDRIETWCILLCSQELLFQFPFRINWFIFARVVPLLLRWI